MNQLIVRQNGFNPFPNTNISDSSKLSTLKTTISNSMNMAEILQTGRKHCGKA